MKNCCPSEWPPGHTSIILFITSTVERICRGCLSLPRCKEVAVDEQMIPFTGTCQLKQFVRGKPNPEGLKNFVCAASNGLVLDFEIYQGKNTFLHEETKHLGVGPSAVIRLSETLPEGTHIFVDRYFTTIPLLEYMLKKKFVVTGTIMKSRIPASAHLASDRIMQRLGRGSSEQYVRGDGKINLVQWYDMKSVLLASTALQIEPQDECRRWAKKESKYVNVSRPHIVEKYNSCMGGIDLIDRMISYYRMSTRTKKWTVKTIIHLFDLGVANAWILYRQDRQNFGDNNGAIMKFLEFKTHVASFLFEEAKSAEDTECRVPSIVTRNTPSSLRTSTPVIGSSRATKRIEHLPSVASNLKNSVRCKNPGCKKKTKFFCETCNMFLCLTGTKNCFRDYHMH